MNQLSVPDARAYLLQLASKQGVGLEVYSEDASSTSVKAFAGEVSEFKMSRRGGLGLRALANGAFGYSYTENRSEPALERAFQTAVENASLVAPEGHASFAAHPEPPHVGDLYGEGLSGVTVDRKVAVAIELERAARAADPRVVSLPYAGYQDGENEYGVANTAGLERSYKANYATQYAYPLVSEGGQNKMAGDFQFTREFEQLDPTRTALEAVRKSTAMLGARKPPSGSYPAVFEHECMASLLMSFTGAFSAKMVQEGKSPIGDKLGQTIGSSLVTLRDDATRPGGQESRPFDEEGYPSSPLTLIEAGRLTAFMHNTETASKAGTHSTGHGARYSYKGTVTVGSSNFYLEPGHGTLSELLSPIQQGVLVTSLHGMHAGVNLVTGDFSLQADGFWIENGKITHPLENFTVAGNFIEVLSNVDGVADDLKFGMYGGAGSPSVRVSKLSVAGE
jgi:PmbA protein